MIAADVADVAVFTTSAAGRGKRAGGALPPSLHPDLEMTHLILTHIPQRKFSHGHTWA